MSFRTRLTLVSAAAVALSIALAAGIIFFAERRQVYEQLNESLRARSSEVAEQLFMPGERRHPVMPPPFGGPGGYAQLVTAQGRVDHLGSSGPFLDASQGAVEVADGVRGSFFEDVFVNGSHLRVFTAPLDNGLALQVARPLDEIDEHLRQTGLTLLLVSLGGVGLAAFLGHAVTRATLTPVSRLTATTERVTNTSDLSERIEVTANDELGRLAASFNRMLEALQSSLRAQRQLVADASHELRTPLTSLQANIQVLTRAQSLSEQERRELIDDVRAELQALRILVEDVVELGRAEQSSTEWEDLRLDLIVERAVHKARRRATAVEFDCILEPWWAHAHPNQIERAVDNLLDNAIKWSPAGSAVEVRLKSGELSVRDHGPGIDAAHLPHVFDRFYRAPSARRMPGSGLGLAIVHKVAEDHAGRVVAENAPDGGARFRLAIPSSS
jgi:two-component system sensor histidine kinase MprB